MSNTKSSLVRMQDGHGDTVGTIRLRDHMSPSGQTQGLTTSIGRNFRRLRED